MPPRDPLTGLRDRPILLALVALAAIAAAVGVALASPTRYRAEADVIVSPVNAESEQLEGLGLLQGARGSVVAAARLVESPPVTELVRTRLHLPKAKQAALRNEISVTPLPQSDLVAIESTADSPRQATRLANTFATALIAERTRAFQRRRTGEAARLGHLIADLSRGDARPDRNSVEVLRERLRTLEAFKGADDPTLAVFKRATVPDEPTSRPTLAIAAAFISVLVGGVGLTLALAGLTPRVLTESELPGSVPVLARVPRLAWRARDPLRPISLRLAEPFRTLRIRLAAGRPDGRLPQTVVVTSAGRREGKTTAALQLALAAAAAHQRVILVDGDLSRPRLERAVGLSRHPMGLTGLLAGEPQSIERLLIDLDNLRPGLRLLPAGTGRGQELVDPGRLSALLARLLEHAEVVIVDSPVITHYADALALAHAADAVLLAVALGRTRRDRVVRALEVFGTAGIEPTGLVVRSRRRLLWSGRAGRRTALGMGLTDSQVLEPAETPAASREPS